jgi:hypothetical protein
MDSRKYYAILCVFIIRMVASSTFIQSIELPTLIDLPTYEVNTPPATHDECKPVTERLRKRLIAVCFC